MCVDFFEGRIRGRVVCLGRTEQFRTGGVFVFRACRAGAWKLSERARAEMKQLEGLLNNRSGRVLLA